MMAPCLAQICIAVPPFAWHGMPCIHPFICESALAQLDTNGYTVLTPIQVGH